MLSMRRKSWIPLLCIQMKSNCSENDNVDLLVSEMTIPQTVRPFTFPQASLLVLFDKWHVRYCFLLYFFLLLHFVFAHNTCNYNSSLNWLLRFLWIAQYPCNNYADRRKMLTSKMSITSQESELLICSNWLNLLSL